MKSSLKSLHMSCFNDTGRHDSHPPSVGTFHTWHCDWLSYIGKKKSLAHVYGDHVE
jgi:hypothetical protein